MKRHIRSYERDHKIGAITFHQAIWRQNLCRSD